MGGTEWIQDDLHQSALEQHAVLSLAPVQLLRTVRNPPSPAVTHKYLLNILNKQPHFKFCDIKQQQSLDVFTWRLRWNLLDVYLGVGGGGRTEHSCVKQSVRDLTLLISSINNQSFHVKANVFPVSWTLFVTALQLIETLERGGNAPGAYVALADASHALQPPKDTESTRYPAWA